MKILGGEVGRRKGVTAKSYQIPQGWFYEVVKKKTETCGPSHPRLCSFPPLRASRRPVSSRQRAPPATPRPRSMRQSLPLVRIDGFQTRPARKGPARKCRNYHGDGAQHRCSLSTPHQLCASLVVPAPFVPAPFESHSAHLAGRSARRERYGRFLYQHFPCYDPPEAELLAGPLLMISSPVKRKILARGWAKELRLLVKKRVLCTPTSARHSASTLKPLFFRKRDPSHI